MIESDQEYVSFRFQRRQATSTAYALMAIVAVAVTARALHKPHTPRIDTKLRSGQHILLVFVAPTGMPTAEFARAVSDAKDTIRDRAARMGYLYGTVGVSDDWSIGRGLRRVQAFGDFDEIVIGRNWFNDGIQNYIIQMRAPDAVPQLILLTERVAISPLQIVDGGKRELIRLVGGDEIASWAKRGFPLDIPVQ